MASMVDRKTISYNYSIPKDKRHINTSNISSFDMEILYQDLIPNIYFNNRSDCIRDIVHRFLEIFKPSFEEHKRIHKRKRNVVFTWNAFKDDLALMNEMAYGDYAIFLGISEIVRTAIKFYLDNPTRFNLPISDQNKSFDSKTSFNQKSIVKPIDQSNEIIIDGKIHHINTQKNNQRNQIPLSPKPSKVIIPPTQCKKQYSNSIRTQLWNCFDQKIFTYDEIQAKIPKARVRYITLIFDEYREYHHMFNQKPREITWKNQQYLK